MAMAQAHRVRDLLAGQVDGLDVEVVGIQTSGDVWRGDLAMLGGKGAFLKEIDKALRAGSTSRCTASRTCPGTFPWRPAR